ncbi:molybdate transport system substrate-binding protein [Nitrobacteraceae bacterium AZCC 2161]
MSRLTVLSGGAAHGLVNMVTEQFTADTGFRVEGEYSAVGVMAERLRSGLRTDLVILTRSLIAELSREGLVIDGSARDLGTVLTGVAFRTGDTASLVASSEALRAALLAADAIYVPDMTQSTAGTHIASVLAGLGIANEVQPCLQSFPNGATAMRELAASRFARPIGCTQITEILTTPGVALAGPLPKDCELATVYTAVLGSHGLYPDEAMHLLSLLTGDGSDEYRIRAGFI